MNVEERLARRKAREHQAASRGDERSAVSQFEDAAMLLALECGLVSEGQAARALGLDRVSLRDAKHKLALLGEALVMELWDEAKKRACLP